MDINSIFAKLKNVLQMGAGASLAIGNPVKVGDLSIIPVAKIAFGFGGGGGSSPSKPKKTEAVKEASPEAEKQQDAEPTVSQDSSEANIGGGGGGGIKTDPIGIYAIHGDKVKFYPVISIKEIAALAGLILLFSYRFARLKWRKK